MSRTQIKYCGNHSLGDLKNTIHSACEYVGFVFAESKRGVDPDQVTAWLKHVLPGENQSLVGLFVNPSIGDIHHVLSAVPLDIIQLHGAETRHQAEKIADISGLKVWKAIHHADNALEQMKHYESVCAGYVVDCKVQGQWGGTGQSFDWTFVPQYMAEAKRQGVPCFIAGGINSQNVEDLLQYAPEGIDLSSGIETDGQKDRHKIRQIEEKMI